MAKRRKNRTHLKGQVQREEVASGVPKSFIIKHGQVGASINQLVRDMRKVMEPHTASRLKVRVITLHYGLFLTLDIGEE
jgi:ribosome biogenesis protein SSF1/2